MKAYAGKTVTKDDIIKAWNSILLDFRKESLDYLEKLKKKYKLFLLSNTNIIHLDAFNTIFELTINKHSFDSLFDKAYYSHEIGLRKPGPAAFEFVLKDNNLKAEETLFIDDTIMKNPTIAAIATSTTKPSFLLSDKVYQKVTDVTDENWLLRTVEVSLKYFQKELTKNEVFR